MARKMTRKDVGKILRILEIEKMHYDDRIYFARKQGIQPSEWEIEKVDELTELMEVFGEYMRKQDLRRQ